MVEYFYSIFFSRMFECREYVIQVLSNYTQVGIFFDETNLFSAISAQQTHVQHGLDNILLEKLSRSFYSRSLSALSVSVEYAVSFFYIWRTHKMQSFLVWAHSSIPNSTKQLTYVNDTLRNLENLIFYFQFSPKNLSHTHAHEQIYIYDSYWEKSCWNVK